MKTMLSIATTTVVVLAVVGFAYAGMGMSHSYDMSGGILQNGVTSFSRVPDCSGAGGAGAGGIAAGRYIADNTLINGVTVFSSSPIDPGACFGRTEESEEGAILYNGVTDFGVSALHKKM